MPNLTVGFFVGVAMVQNHATWAACSVKATEGLKDIADVTPIYFSGYYETNCTDIPDDTGLYSETRCPVVRAQHFCSQEGNFVGYIRNTYPTFTLASEVANGAYCYCRVARVENYGMDNETLVQATPHWFLVIHPTRGGVTSPAPYASPAECANNCPTACKNALAKEIAPFMIVFTESMKRTS